MITEDNIKKLKVSELKQDLKARGLRTGDLKPELIDRLQKSMEDKVCVLPEGVLEAITTAAKAFDKQAYWKILKPETQTQNNPLAGTNFAEPTDTEPVKIDRHHNFANTFQRHLFTGTAKKQFSTSSKK